MSSFHLPVGLPAHEVGPSQVGLYHGVPSLESHVSSSTRKLTTTVVYQEVKLTELGQSELV